ncbi:hypothetical protein MKK88_05700 [Methylobacterium sp. E-005]|uniref:hypothetical protein n=1 Tax=Methylobacterium sp. E-005 TaxID=2836549 RepID=UPI001FBB3058|nr:hypothetical protein [Methylobacterium sp. E-005]MCJ2085488.1 hypothetical protein [Methylobacterium sp. E-005]
MARQYPFPLPHKISPAEGATISMALNMKAVHDALPRLPAALVAKLQTCSLFTHPTFTKAELDSVPDDLWLKLAPHLG